MRHSIESLASEAGDRSRDDTPLLPQHTRDCDTKDERRRFGVPFPSEDSDDDSQGDRRRIERTRTDSDDAAYAKRIRAHRRQHRLASLAYSSTLICFAVSCILAAGVIGWVAHFLYMRHEAYSTAVFARPLIPEPVSVEERVPPFVRPGDESASDQALSRNGTQAWQRAQVEQELDRRFRHLGLPGGHSMQDLSCVDLSQLPASTLTDRYYPLRSTNGTSTARQGRTLLALNLFNSQDLLPSLSQTLLAVADYLGSASVHISIFENGSKDHTTTMLAHLAAALTALGVDHTIVSDPRETDWKAVDRIDQLAVYRNVAMEPMRSQPDAGWGDVVFINDVYICPTDVLELMFQRKAQDADAACAMDWRRTKGLGRWWRDGVKFYDNWVSRSLRGGMLRARADVFAEFRDGVDELWDQPGEESSRERFQLGLPVPVYSCWNGMLSLTAEPFVSTASSSRYNLFAPSASSETWRRPPPIQVDRPVQFRSALNHMGECAASECKTLAKDFWSRGFDRWVIVPSVRTTYDLDTYSHPQLVELVSRHSPSQSALRLDDGAHVSSYDPTAPTERIRWSDWTPPQEIICWAWVRGFHLDFEIIRASWERPWAYARSLITRARF